MLLDLWFLSYLSKVMLYGFVDRFISVIDIKKKKSNPKYSFCPIYVYCCWWTKVVNWDRADGGREAIFVDESTMIFLFFNRKFPIFPIFSILSFLFSYFPIFLFFWATVQQAYPFFFFFFFCFFKFRWGKAGKKSIPIHCLFHSGPRLTSLPHGAKRRKPWERSWTLILMTMILLTVRLLFSLVEE